MASEDKDGSFVSEPHLFNNLISNCTVSMSNFVQILIQYSFSLQHQWVCIECPGGNHAKSTPEIVAIDNGRMIDYYDSSLEISGIGCMFFNLDWVIWKMIPTQDF